MVAALAAFATPSLAEAGEPKRSGGQVDILLGGSGCIPARGDCKFEDGTRMTRPSAGLGFDIGWRAHKAFFLGAGYTVGWFTPTWRVGDRNDREFRNAYQQGAFLVLRAYIPVWLFDIGFELSPGWSQATFVAEGSNLRQLSHGFALRPGMSFDVRLGRHLYIGARVDFMVNFHSRFCTADGSRECGAQPTIRQLPVHQVIGGVHFGANF
jgi:hypothetical protein